MAEPERPWEQELANSPLPTTTPALRAYGVGPDVKDAVVRHVEKAGYNMGAMATAGGLTVRRLQKALNDDPIFRERVDESRLKFLASLEVEAYRRAVEGVEQEKVGAGGVTYVVKQFSDSLLTLLLKSNAPEKYGDKIQVERRDEVNVRIGFDQLPQAARLKFLEALDAAAPGIRDAEATLLSGSPDESDNRAPSVPGMRPPGEPDQGGLDPAV